MKAESKKITILGHIDTDGLNGYRLHRGWDIVNWVRDKILFAIINLLKTFDLFFYAFDEVFSKIVSQYWWMSEQR